MNDINDKTRWSEFFGKDYQAAKRRFNWTGVMAGIFMFAAAAVFAQSNTALNPCTPWPAMDALGRKLPLPEEVGAPKSDKFVGIFYFLCLNEQGNKCPYTDGPYDVSKILAKDPDALKKSDSPLWGPIGLGHYWGEPLYGYYLSSDPWVLRRHAQSLADAGIDTVLFDTTNAVTYKDVYMKLCEVFAQVRKDGGRTPQIAFMVNTEAGKTALEIYNDLYRPGLYKELWFQWQGKPLMICDPEAANDELKKFFTLRRAHWPFEMINTKNAWHWEAAYPQPYGYTDDPSKAEQVNVSIAQNLRAKDGKVTNMSYGDARGRSFHNGKQDITADSVNEGYNFEEQWKRAYELQPPFVMVTGWNEWVAGRWGEPKGPVTFVDQFSEEYSRDIEPMKGGHNDNYYWQLVSNVRKFKGAPALPESSAPKKVNLDGGFEQWQDVAPSFVDHVGETAPRDYDGAAGHRYTNKTGRNDLVEMKVARDEKNIYFYARTREAMTSSSDPNWMWLLIDIDQNVNTGWCGYDFIVNRTMDSNGKTWLEKNKGDWQWEKVAEVTYQVKDKELQIVIPRTVLGLPENKTSASFDFKWADNLQIPGDIMDVYLSGDVAPEGRFMYRYTGK